MRTVANALEARYTAAFKQLFKPSLNGAPQFLHELREEAISCFDRLGFPKKGEEAWKYTSLANILRTPLAVGQHAPPPTVVRSLGGNAAHRAVYVNGTLSPTLSSLETLPSGVIVSSLRKSPQDLVSTYLSQRADIRNHPFAALNTAFLRDGALVYIPRGVVIEEPIHILHVLTGTAPTLAQPRTLVIAEEHAHAHLIENTEVNFSDPSLINSVCEIFVGAGAHVSRSEVQEPPSDVCMVTSVDAYQGPKSHFQNNCFTFGGDVVRNNVHMLPDAEHCETLLHGLFIGRGHSHIDSHTIVDHAKPQCYSSENYRGILDDRATGVFNGRVLVRQDAQQINAYQTNKSIVLSRTAHMYAKPELEIYADDVKCSHGATTGQLDEDALFYLRARGLTPYQARVLMLRAFARDIVDSAPIESLRDFLDQRVAKSLAH